MKPERRISPTHGEEHEGLKPREAGKWFVGGGGFHEVSGDENGTVRVESRLACDDISIAILEECPRSSLPVPVKEVLKDLAERNWEKWKRKIPAVIGVLAYGDYVAELASKKIDAKVDQTFTGDGDHTFFCSSFNSTGMSYNEKMKAIIKVLDAMDMAVKEFWNNKKRKDFSERRDTESLKRP